MDKQISLDEMMKVSTSAPLSDGRMGRCELTQTSEGQLRVTHLACLSVLSNSKGQRWEQNRKEGTVLSQAGRAGHVREPSVRHEQRQIVPFCDSALMRVRNENRLQQKIKFSGISRGDKNVGESRNNAESEPAVKYNESREVGHKWAKVNTSPLH